jgi:pimeloyl-ACP methyl ester carboxylesterase
MIRGALIAALTFCSALVVSAQDLTGDWQGTLQGPNGELRVVLRIEDSASGGWKVTEFTPDQGSNGMVADDVALEGSTLDVTFARINGSYRGTISGDGTSIEGNWVQGRTYSLTLTLESEESSWLRDDTPHTIHLVAVQDDVQVEVIDWGGSGRAVILLPGGGNNAHGFDGFAPKLTASYHLYGITRRGSGASSAPVPTNGNYSADRLGDDVLAVMDALDLDRPVLVGHSLGGQELSSIGSRHPEKVAGLIYLDAAYQYAYYNRAKGDLFIEVNEVRRKLERLEPGNLPQDPKPLINELLETNLPELERSLRQQQERLQAAPPRPAPARPRPPLPAIERAIQAGAQRYTEIRAPALAIYALQPVQGADDSPARVATEARNQMKREQADAFEAGVPAARVVRIADADHYVYVSNEEDVLREINDFISGLRLAVRVL